LIILSGAAELVELGPGTCTKATPMAACAAALFALSGGAAVAQERGKQDDQNRQNHSKFDDHDRQVTQEWYKQHQNKAPAGFRNQDRLSPDEESHLQVGSALDSRLRTKVHPVPGDLSRQLAPPPHNSRYVAIGGHVAQIDKQNRVEDVMHVQVTF
jgi:Ni/Co efflux regulator RcnB